MEETNSLFEVQESRNGMLVPVINNIFLHSIYNPQKEAEAFAKSNLAAIQSRSHILILGLGFGYHIKALAKALEESGNTDFQILIIEANSQLVDSYIEHTGGFNDSRIKILNSSDPSSYFENSFFINFSLAKPAIIKHDPSFSLNRDFYTSFLTHKASDNIESYLHLITNQDFQTYLYSSQSEDLNSVVNKIAERGSVETSEEFAILGFATLINDFVEEDHRGAHHE